MPRIWADTIDSHRRQVQDAVLDATADLILEHGPMSVSMSAIADRAGIGRATLYKYFPDVEAILLAWHTRDFGNRLEQLHALAGSPTVTLDDVMAFIRAERGRQHMQARNHAVGALAHAVAGTHDAMPGVVESQVIDTLTGLMRQLARRKQVRADVAPGDLARWLFHTVHAPAEIDNDAAAELLAASLAPKTPPRPSRARRRT